MTHGSSINLLQIAIVFFEFGICPCFVSMYNLGTIHFILITDHSALKWLHSAEPKGRIGRWILKLQPYNFEILHKPRRIYSNVDALSRLPTQTDKPFRS